MTDSASMVGDGAPEAQRGLTQQVRAELELEPTGSQPFPTGPCHCPALQGSTWEDGRGYLRAVSGFGWVL